MPNPAHLSKFEKIIPNGAEWHLAASDWVVFQLAEGIAYVFESKDTKELRLGGVIVCPPKSQITLTASVLERALFHGMAIRVGSLAGVPDGARVAMPEMDVARQCAPFLALAPDHALAGRMTQLFAQQQAPALSDRLAFTQAFAELVGPQLCEAMNTGRQSDKNQQEAKGRLQELISQIPESELSSLSLGELAKQLHCCERHASRLFREEWGTSFPSYVAEIRLKKACQLLLQANLKIIDVALDSGHGSLAHFNYVFKRRFHKTPTEWRERQLAPPRRSARTRLLQIAAAVVWLLFSVAGITHCLAAESVEPPATNTSISPISPITPTATNAPASAAPPAIYKLDRFEVLGNTLLSTNVIANVLAPYTGEGDADATVGRITNGMIALKLEYFRRGWFTVEVAYPPQKLTNGVVIYRVTEGRLAAIRIAHNRFFSSNNIMRQLPYVKSLESGGGFLNTNIFQIELDRANSNPDRQIRPEVRPGLEPGTSALVLDVTDKLPLHGRVDLDNFSPPGTPELRINANLSYANLWQLDHTLGLQYGFSPEETKPSLGSDTHVSLNPMDAPEVSYYSGFYRAPFGAPVAAEDQIAQDPNHFGYNETTKQFVQPPNIGRPEFTAYASRSTTGPTIYGLSSSVVDTRLLQIEQQLITQQYTSQTTAGGRFSFPLPIWQGVQSTWSIGMDYKNDKVVTLPTNYFYYLTIIHTNANNGTTPVVAKNTIAIPGVQTYPSLQYTPFFLGWNGSRQDHFGQGPTPSDRWSHFNAGLSMVAGLGGTFSREQGIPDTDFRQRGCHNGVFGGSAAVVAHPGPAR